MRVPKRHRLSSKELEALIKRVEARSLQKGDEQIITAIIEKTFALSQMIQQDEMPSLRRLRQFMGIRRPKKSK